MGPLLTLQVCSGLHQRYAEFQAELVAKLVENFGPGAGGEGPLPPQSVAAACSLRSVCMGELNA